MASDPGKNQLTPAAASASWRSRTLDELAAEQGVKLPQDKQAMLGEGADLWESDKEFDDFLADIYQRRRAALPGGGRAP